MQWLERAWQPLQHGYALLVVMIGWVFFRADTLQHALSYLGVMAELHQVTEFDYAVSLYLNAEIALLLGIGAIAALPILPFIVERFQKGISRLNYAQTPFAALAFYSCELLSLSVLFLGSAMKMASGTYNPFLYFRF